MYREVFCVLLGLFAVHAQLTDLGGTPCVQDDSPQPGFCHSTIYWRFKHGAMIDVPGRQIPRGGSFTWVCTCDVVWKGWSKPGWWKCTTKSTGRPMCGGPGYRNIRLLNIHGINVQDQCELPKY